MAIFYHYTDAAGILAIIQSGKILKQEGSEHFALGEAVFLTRLIKATKVDGTSELFMRGMKLSNQYTFIKAMICYGFMISMTLNFYQ